MRKVTLLIITLFMVTMGFSQDKFAEFTMNWHLKNSAVANTNLYDSIVSICNEKNIDYVIHHYYSDDPFQSINSLRRSHDLLDRTYDDFRNYMPNGFVMGQNLRMFRLGDDDYDGLLKPSRYDDLANANKPIIDSLNAWGEVEYTDYINPIFKFKIEVLSDVNLTNARLQTFIVEDMSMVDGDKTLYFKNIERAMLPTYNGMPYSDLMEINLAWDSNWEVDSCHVVFLLEDEDHNVLGYGRYSIQELLGNKGTGISNFEILAQTKIYPNPTTSEFNIESDELIQNLRIYSMTGSLLYENNDVNDYRFVYNQNDLNNGMYLIMVNNTSQRLIVN